MAKKSVPNPIPAQTLEKLRTLIRQFPWRAASSARYRNAPHCYVIYFANKRPWKWFARRIREHGRYYSWRGFKYRYLLIDGDCFWIDWPAINRAKADTLDPCPGQKLRPR